MSNKKTKWTEENEYYLLKLIADGNGLEKITKKIKKNEKEIIHKLKKLASKMLIKNKSKDDIMKELKFLSEKQIEKITDSYIKKTTHKKNNELSELSGFGFKKIESQIENSELQKIYNILNEINQKLNLLNNDNPINNNKNNKNNINNKDSDTTETNISQKSAPKIINKNDNNSSSFISSGSDTDEIINLIKNRTIEQNTVKNKYINSKK